MKKTLALLTLLALLGVLAGAGGATQKAPSALYTQIQTAYMQGKWDTLEATFKNGSREIAALDRTETTEINNIKNIMAECRGNWWNAIKANKKKMDIKVNLWGRSQILTFDPELPTNCNRTTVNGTAIFTVNWLIANMDSNTTAERGFTKGDVLCMDIFQILGFADAWNIAPPESRQADDAMRLAFLRYRFFRGNVTAAEYGTPRSRQWTTFLALHYYHRQYEKVQERNSLKVIGAWFLGEVLSHPKTYPSIQLPKTIDAEDSEEKLAIALADIIEKNQWTYAEDNELRAAIKTFAASNLAGPFKSGKVELPNKLPFALDPEADKPLQPKRNQWIKQTLEKIK